MRLAVRSPQITDWLSKAPGGAARSLAFRSNLHSASAFPRQTAQPDGKPLNLDKEMFALLAEQFGLEVRTRVYRWR
ncbi:hypothetical protein LPU83_pLPU83a_0066 (plasmid) [Rhizobium favelukesii]|uniref:Uncharacterized protein n=1 Tax=Rhizobium favelukesii TaxID=348824 RepID=W6RF53_9HYPH|nr:hypothetical protein LPU83_pLPU83a_0066 [Rhizobium favelukesii]